jgi:hypothetical protein
MDETENIDPEGAAHKTSLHNEVIGERNDDAVPSEEDLQDRTERRLEAERKLDQHLNAAHNHAQHPEAG